MPNFWYTHAKNQLGAGALNLGTADLRVLLAEVPNTTEDDDANRDVTSISGFTTLNEHPTAGRIALVNQVYAVDNANNRSELTADPTVFPNLADSGEQVQNAILYLHVTDDTDSYPVASFDTGGFPFTPTGEDNTITWNAEGVVQVT